MTNQNDQRAKQVVGAIADYITKKAADKGKIIEFGFRALMESAWPTATDEQKEELRMAFFAGAQHLWGSMISLVESGEEASAEELRRIILIDAELNSFIREFKEKLEKKNAQKNQAQKEKEATGN